MRIRTILFFSLIILSIGRIKGESKCKRVNFHCKEFYNYENHDGKNYHGHSRKIFDFLSGKKEKDDRFTGGFFCLLYHPPCLKDESDRNDLSLRPKPCQSTCKTTWKTMKRTRKGRALWPKNLRCEVLPTSHCYSFKDNFQLEYIGTKKHHHAKQSHQQKHKHTKRQKNESRAKKRRPQLTNVQLLKDDDNVVEVVSFGGDKELQDREAKEFNANMDYFHGWVDVQGKGSNNDYCRVIGKGHRKFLACSLDGEISDTYTYVSKLGFDPGHRDTWYMKDEDLDGRDDYCRCVGNSTSSFISCMKAGRRGFYGGPMVGGDQYTFSVPGSSPCL